VLFAASVGVVFFVLHVVTARRFGRLMPRCQTSPFWWHGGHVTTGRLSLTAGPALSLALSAAAAGEKLQPDGYAALVAVQVIIYLFILAMYRRNAASAEKNRGPGGPAGRS